MTSACTSCSNPVSNNPQGGKEYGSPQPNLKDHNFMAGVCFAKPLPALGANATARSTAMDSDGLRRLNPLIIPDARADPIQTNDLIRSGQICVACHRIMWRPGKTTPPGYAHLYICTFVHSFQVPVYQSLFLFNPSILILHLIHYCFTHKYKSCSSSPCHTSIARKGNSKCLPLVSDEYLSTHRHGVPCFFSSSISHGS